MTPEAKVKKQVKEILDRHNAYYFMPATGGYGASGVPDIVACINGMFVGIECKADGNQPTKLQLKHLNDIADSGGLAFTVDASSLGVFAMSLATYIAPAYVGETHFYNLTKRE